MRSLSESRTGNGFTLVEVLIAVIVLSIGLLGVAASHVNALKASQAAEQRTLANIMAADLFDRIRADVAEATSFSHAADDPAPTGGSSLAQTELSSWFSLLNSSLPGAKADIEVSRSSASSMVIYKVVLTLTIQDRKKLESDVSQQSTELVYSSIVSPGV